MLTVLLVQVRFLIVLAAARNGFSRCPYTYLTMQERAIVMTMRDDQYISGPLPNAMGVLQSQSRANCAG